MNYVNLLSGEIYREEEEVERAKAILTTRVRDGVGEGWGCERAARGCIRSRTRGSPAAVKLVEHNFLSFSRSLFLLCRKRVDFVV